MTRIARLSIDQIYFSTIPDKRVAEIDAALDAQRVNRRTATDDLDRGTVERNIADLKTALDQANVNLKAHNAHMAKLEAAEAAKQKENDDRALAAITDQLRTNYLAQPGTTVKEFEQVLPELLAEHRKQAVLNAPAVFAQQVAEAKQRLGNLF
jgi:predicted  nucleic acid-binding Zn-ribbon protein